MVHSLVSLRGIAVGAAMLLLALLQGMLLVLALSNAQIGAGAVQLSGFENYVTLAYSAEFRRTLLNTFALTVLTLLIILPVVPTVYGFLTRPGRVRVAVLVAILVPLAMPGALGVLAWRDLLEFASVPLVRRLIVLPVFAVVQAWRVLPLALAVYAVSATVQRTSRLGLALAVAAYWIVADASVVMLLTGGAPQNGTHVLASLVYSTAVISGQTGLGAAMALMLSAAVILLAAVLLGVRRLGVQSTPGRGMTAAPPTETETVAAPEAGRLRAWARWSVLAAMLVWLLLPLAFAVARAGMPWQWGAGLAFLATETGYLGWLSRTCLWAAAAALLAHWVGRPVAPRRVDRAPNARRVAAFGAPALALVTLPIAFVPLLWLTDRVTVAGTLSLALLLAGVVLCLGMGIAAVSGSRLRGDGRHPAAVPVLIAFFVVTQEWANTLALDVGRPQLLNSGLVNGLAFRVDVVPATTALAILISALVLGLILGVFTWVLRPLQVSEMES